MASDKVPAEPDSQTVRGPPRPSPFARVHAAAEIVGSHADDDDEPAPSPAPQPHAPDRMAAVRFQGESALLTALFERFGLEDLIEHFVASGAARSLHDVILGTHIRLTPLVAPRLYGLFDEVRQLLGFDEPVELFVIGDADLNASAYQSPSAGQPHAVTLTSGAVERMTDEELRFVLGHEIGHLAFGHYRALLIHEVLTDDEGESSMPALLFRRLESWGRLAELSADRIGFLAADQRLDTAVSVFFKLTAGLGPEHLRFDIAAFLDQLAAIQGMPRSEILARFSHPVTPVRVRALQLFAESGGRDATPARRDERERAVAAVARLMELEVTEPHEITARDFLTSAGYLGVYAAPDEPSADQRALLVEMLLPLTADPEEALERFSSTEQAEDQLIAACAWLRDNAGEERFALFTAIAHIVCADGELVEPERSYLIEVAALLAIPEQAAMDVLFDVLRGYLKERATRGQPALRPPKSR